METLAGLFADLLLLFEDFKFWLKRKKQRGYEHEHVFPVKKGLYPSQRIYIIALIMLLPLTIITSALFFYENGEKYTAQKLLEVVSLLKHEKVTSGHYPEQLETIGRNNPLLKNVHKDYWGKKFYYERHVSGESYVLVSMGKDGKLDTADDIKSEFEKN